MKTIAIVGAGSHTRSALNILKHFYSQYKFEIFDDSYSEDLNEVISDISLVGKIKDIPSNSKIFLSIGDNNKRELFFMKYHDKIVSENILHKTVFIENNVTLGISNQIYATAYINSYVKIGNNNIINSAAILEHEVKIGDHNHIAVGAKLCGRVNIGNRCSIGSGAVIIDKIRICDDVTIGAGTVVVKDIIQNGTYVGNPARKIK